MKRFVLFFGLVLVAVAGCNAPVKYSPQWGDYLRTDSSMIGHENPANKSSTSVGIPGY